jgi:hypothetical protein
MKNHFTKLEAAIFLALSSLVYFRIYRESLLSEKLFSIVSAGVKSAESQLCELYQIGLRAHAVVKVSYWL